MINYDHSTQLMLSKFGYRHLEKVCLHPWSLIQLDLLNNRNLKLLIAYGSWGKFFHLEEFSKALQKQNAPTDALWLWFDQLAVSAQTDILEQNGHAAAQQAFIHWIKDKSH